MGGKNSMWNKPFGVGKQSVAENPLNISPLHSGTLGPNSGVDIYGGETLSRKVSNIFGGDDSDSVDQLTPAQVEAMMDKGRSEGESAAGGTVAEMGQGRADVRNRLTETLNGNSAAAAGLKQDQQQAQKSLKANQALAGGSGQMNEGQQQALRRQSDMDMAKFRQQEDRKALGDLSKEFRGGVGDIFRSTGQLASIMVGAQPAPQPQSSGGLFG